MDNPSVNSNLNQTLADITSGFINATRYNLDGKVNSMLCSIAKLLDLDRLSLYYFKEGGSYMKNTHECCAKGVVSVIDLQENLSLEKFKWWVEQIFNNNYIYIQDVKSIPKEALAERDLFKLAQIKSLIAVPIRSHKKVIGFFLMVTTKNKKRWEQSNITLLQVLANTLAETHLKITAQEEIEKLSQMQSILLNISKIYLNTHLSIIDTALMDSLKEMAQFVGADRSYIFEYDFKNNITRNSYEWCANGISPEIDNLQSVPLDMLEEWLHKHSKGEAFVVADVSKLPYKGPISVRGILEPQNVKSLISVPMIDEGNLVGFVGFDSVKKLHIYSKDERDLLSFFSKMIVSVNKKATYERLINKAKEEAEKANEAKSNFLANMSHEIRTPLNSVIGFTELLRSTPLNVSQKKFVDNANVAAQSLLEIINDVLDLSKIEAGKLQLNLVKTDVIEFTEQVCDVIKYQAVNKELEILLNVQPNLPRFAIIDPFRLKQVLLNLLSNSIKFTSEGEVELKITYTKKSEGRGIFSFFVRDTGIGISQEDQSRLFEAFVQADSATTRKYGGTGLGLVISNNLVHKMGGTIEIESTLGKGSTFHFSIETESDHSVVEFNSDKLNIERVLIVDDNKNNRQILEYALETWNIESISCENGLDAIKLVKTSKKPFDVIIIDYKMPVINGIDTIRMLRADTSYTKKKQPVIIMSSSEEVSFIDEESKRSGTIHLITKPVKLRDLYNYLLNLSKSGEIPPLPKRISHRALGKSIKESSNKTGRESEGAQELIENPVILVAEDVQMNLLLIRTLIKNFIPGAKVFEAYNGVEAFNIATTQKPDLIFMDVQMPEMDGLAATRQIRKEEKKSKTYSTIIALTAGASKEDKEKCLESGMDYYITKPVNQKELKKTLTKYLKTEDKLAPSFSYPKNKKMSKPKQEVEKEKIEDILTHYNEKEILQRVDNNREVLVDLINSLESEMEDSIANLESDLLNSRDSEARNVAHKIKGVALNMSFPTLVEISKKIEQAIINKDPERDHLFKEIKEEWEIVKKILYSKQTT